MLPNTIYILIFSNGDYDSGPDNIKAFYDITDLLAEKVILDSLIERHLELSEKALSLYQEWEAAQDHPGKPGISSLIEYNDTIGDWFDLSGGKSNELYHKLKQSFFTAEEQKYLDEYSQVKWDWIGSERKSTFEYVQLNIA